MNRRYNGIGMMSGTSLDGMDLAHCAFWEEEGRWEFELLETETIPFEEAWYARLKCLDEQTAETFAKTNVYFGHLVGKTIASFIARHRLQPDFVASHGQTIFHQPQKNFTAQIGDGETIVSYLACPLVTNFRNKDVATGGQGAPLVPFGERHLFAGQTLCLNLGGIANISTPEIAYDICACNMALNWIARSIDADLAFDFEGQIAAKGKLNAALLQQLDELAFYKHRPPKSLGAEWFQAEFLPLLLAAQIPAEDLMHTSAWHIAGRIASDIQSLGFRDCNLLVTGGGSHNKFLMRQLTARLAESNVTLTAVDDKLVDFKEALIFAFLGLQTLLGRTNVLASVTGARHDLCAGSIHLPPNGWIVPLIR